MVGLKELQSEFEKRFDVTLKEPILQKGADYFKEKLEENVYKHGLVKRTGTAQESFEIQMVKGADEVYIGISNQQNAAFYLYFHEWGTSKMRARPFMRPTFEKEMQKIIDEMAKAMKEQLGL